VLLVINPSKQDPTLIYLDKILLSNIYLMKREHSILLNRHDILGYGKKCGVFKRKMFSAFQI